MSTQPKSRFWLWTVLGLVLVLFVVGLLFRIASHRSPVQAAVRFLGYTNNTSGTRLALFEVRNRSSFRIVNSHFSQWVEVQTPTGQQSFPIKYADAHLALKPEETGVVQVPVPAIASPWRVVMGYMAVEGDDIQMVRRVREILSDLGFATALPVEQIESPLVKNPAESGI
jgi:hypothetical protein